MKFTPYDIPGVWLVEPHPVHDERGFFARTFCAREFADHGLETCFVQHSTSYSDARGTLRGLHFQKSPHDEVKLVTCLKGAIWDVVVDLRRGSPTFLRWQAFELSEDNRARLYIPKGVAHGFQSLTDAVEVNYLISTFYAPDATSGVRYDDPAFGIDWPLPPAALSERDRNWPDVMPERDPLA
jgi:dTDP-4-dehydrorhamnose 3,5-epimerase